ncbi:MAG: precorrin-4 C(11)-methyltransferase [Lachnospiraceae bacterium]|uniref:Precorrin-4 C(11)-methyltransferase n=1 Tax=Candidatus Weimeria bifida TaxID=2599074 RepID=A0A6N7IYS4_9FIRM|nr:precorrin-4 C(11)-methyltransferase [Candidatus Weimeria bifida]RRF97219.1 MAG: precorrin-4 C(11)-methyltransferase [Lachnospiraceae bacterium]
MVHFVGAGPGAVDLITVRGLSFLKNADVLIYAGSLVSAEFADFLKKDALVYNSAKMTLEEVEEVILMAEAEKKTTVRLHTGDPSLYGAIAEQIAFLKEKNIPYDVTPGVTAAFAAASEMGMEYTLPGISQTLILTRTAGRTPVPPEESVENLARTHSSMAIYLSVNRCRELKQKLLAGGYSEDTPAAIAFRVSWPDQKIIRTTVGKLDSCQENEGIVKTALVIVGDALSQSDFDRSCLYDPDFTTEYRK